jgi:antitoxin HicB
MNYTYPFNLTKLKRISIIEFPDVCEALTFVHNEKDILKWAEDALIVALSGYVDDKREFPRPSETKEGQGLIYLSDEVINKLKNGNFCV